MATPQGLQYTTDDKDDRFTVSLADLEQFQVDYQEKNLKVKVAPRQAGTTSPIPTATPIGCSSFTATWTRRGSGSPAATGRPATDAGVDVLPRPRSASSIRASAACRCCARSAANSLTRACSTSPTPATRPTATVRRPSSRRRSTAVTSALIGLGAKAVVVACNTATGAAVDVLRQTFSAADRRHRAGREAGGRRHAVGSRRRDGNERHAGQHEPAAPGRAVSRAGRHDDAGLSGSGGAGGAGRAGHALDPGARRAVRAAARGDRVPTPSCSAAPTTRFSSR